MPNSAEETPPFISEGHKPGLLFLCIIRDLRTKPARMAQHVRSNSYCVQDPTGVRDEIFFIWPLSRSSSPGQDVATFPTMPLVQRTGR